MALLRPCEGQRALSFTAGNAQEVADTILRIIETPVGEKKLRYFISPRNFSVDEINALSKQVQAMLEAFRLAADTKFFKGKAVGHLGLSFQKTFGGIRQQKVCVLKWRSKIWEVWSQPVR